ncbi:hypothetical protein Bbelb_320110 [Branchiostoma belcheri]|nr:hypothetical protein Bbelb_320110 [Branchiostoma belcheri]
MGNFGTTPMYSVFWAAPICRSYLPGVLNPADGDRSHLAPTTSPSANFIGQDREGFRDSAGRVYLTPDDQPSFCYYADQAATLSEGSQRSTTGLEGGRSFAPPSKVGRSKSAQCRGMRPRRHRPGSSRPNGDGSPLPSACEYALRTRWSETWPPTLPAGASVVRVRDRKQRSGVAGSSALRLPRVRGQLYGAFPPLRQRRTWAVRMSPTVERRALSIHPRRLSSQLDPPNLRWYSQHVSLELSCSTTEHVTTVVGRGSKRLYVLRNLKKHGLETSDLILIFIGFVRPVLEYACVLWHPGLTRELSLKIERVQKRALRTILGNDYTDYQSALNLTGLSRLDARRQELCLRFATSLVNSEKYHALWAFKHLDSRGADYLREQ